MRTLRQKTALILGLVTVASGLAMPAATAVSTAGAPPLAATATEQPAQPARDQVDLRWTADPDNDKDRAWHHVYPGSACSVQGFLGSAVTNENDPLGVLCYDANPQDGVHSKGPADVQKVCDAWYPGSVALNDTANSIYDWYCVRYEPGEEHEVVEEVA